MSWYECGLCKKVGSEPDGTLVYHEYEKEEIELCDKCLEKVRAFIFDEKMKIKEK